MIPTTAAVSQERSFFLLSSLGTQNARKRLTIHIIEVIIMTNPKLPLISFLRRFCTSFGSIPIVFVKNIAWSGLKAIYARKLPKNMIDINKRDPISLKNKPIEIGSLGFWGVSSLRLILSSGLVGHTRGVEVFFWEALRISERRETCCFFSPSSGGIGVSLIEKIKNEYRLSI